MINGDNPKRILCDWCRVHGTLSSAGCASDVFSSTTSICLSFLPRALPFPAAAAADDAVAVPGPCRDVGRLPVPDDAPAAATPPAPVGAATRRGLALAAMAVACAMMASSSSRGGNIMHFSSTNSSSSYDSN